MWRKKKKVLFRPRKPTTVSISSSHAICFHPSKLAGEMAAVSKLKRNGLTLRSQQVRVEAKEVRAEVEPALAGHFAPPIAARVICDQLFHRWQLKPLLKPQKGFPKLLRVFLQHQGCLPFLSNETLTHQTSKVTAD